MALELLDAHRRGIVEVAIGRASDYFGSRGGAQSNPGDRLFPAAIAGRTATVLGNLDQPHTYTFIPDIGEGLAVLGEHPDAPGKAWHLPNDPHTQTTRQLVDTVYRQLGHPRGKVRSLPPLVLRTIGTFNPTMREIVEMQYQFEAPFIVDSTPMAQLLGVTGTPLAHALTLTGAHYEARHPATYRRSASPAGQVHQSETK
jgi:nucleoside-diphosphate-sugar epimerase